MKKILLILFLLIISGTCFGAVPSDYSRGVDYYNQKSYSMAKIYFYDAVQKNPNDANSRYYLGLTYLQLKNYTKAKAEFNKVLTLVPKTSTTHQYSLTALKKIKLVEEKNQQTQKAAQENAEENFHNSERNWKWKKFPVSVYVAPTEEYKNIVKSACNDWQTFSKGLVSFTFTNNKEKAQIRIKYVEVYVRDDKIYYKDTNEEIKKCASSNWVGCTRTEYTKDENGPVLHKNIEIMKNYPAKWKLSKFGHTEIYHTTLHEIGHALGISGHSPSCDDVMGTSCTFEKHASIQLSERDLNTLKKVYQDKTIKAW